MTEASGTTSESSQLNDLSYKSTVPLPKADGPTSRSSTISDSGLLSMPKESDISSEIQRENSKKF